VRARGSCTELLQAAAAGWWCPRDKQFLLGQLQAAVPPAMLRRVCRWEAPAALNVTDSLCNEAYRAGGCPGLLLHPVSPWLCMVLYAVGNQLFGAGSGVAASACSLCVTGLAYRWFWTQPCGLIIRLQSL
jgi:hypothetical protein